MLTECGLEGAWTGLLAEENVCTYPHVHNTCITYYFFFPTEVNRAGKKILSFNE